MIVLSYKHGNGNTDYEYVEQRPILKREKGTNKIVPAIQERSFIFKLTSENGGFRLTVLEKEAVPAGDLFRALIELVDCNYCPVSTLILDCPITAGKNVTFRDLEVNINTQLIEQGLEPLDSEYL